MIVLYRECLFISREKISIQFQIIFHGKSVHAQVKKEKSSNLFVLDLL